MGITFSKRTRRSKSPYSPSVSSLSGSSISTRNGSLLSQDSLYPEQVLPLNKTVLEQSQAWIEHHKMTKDVWGEHFGAPVGEWLKFGGVKVMDIGCGGGAWTIDLATEYPLSDFIGVDVEPIIPKQYPSNVEFVQADIKMNLPFPDNTFDFIHMRYMMFCLTERDWINIVIPELIRVLKPGGYMEIVESDIEWCNVSKTSETIISAAHNVMRQSGIDPFIINRVYDIMDNTEMFQPIYHKVADSQIGKWAGERGAKVLDVYSYFFIGIQTPICKLLKISEDEFETVLKQLQKDVEIYKSYCKAHRFYAAKKIMQ